MKGIVKSQYMSLDTRGLDKIVDNLSTENRAPVLKKAMESGAKIVQTRIRRGYEKIKPDSDLGRAIVRHTYPSGEGVIVRRFYRKGIEKSHPLYRSYVLNFIEKGAVARKTKGNGRRYAGQKLNRGSIPAYKFFAKGCSASRNKAMKEIERVLLVGLSRQAMKQ